jgi:hypothetical protein
MKDRWLEVDRQGLAKQLEGKSKAWVVYELLQNIWDEPGVRKASIRIEPIPNSPYVRVYAEDDAPEGFTRLDDAYTLFAESKKAGDPTLRGRFNVGEKYVLSLGRVAGIVSTAGSVEFRPDGTRKKGRVTRDKGTLFFCEMRMTREELTQVEEDVRKVIPEPGIETTFQGDVLPLWTSWQVAEFEATLPTIVGDAEGVLRRTKRKTTVRVYDRPNLTPPNAYEIGIPVCGIPEDKYHIDVRQRVPLSTGRDSLTPAFLQTLRTDVFNATFERLNKTDMTSTWARAATSSEDVKDEALQRSVDLRFGKRRTSYDPSDREANSRATAKGYTVVPGGSLSGGEWANVKDRELIKPSGVVTPTPKPFSEDGEPVAEITPETWCHGMKEVVALAHRLGKYITGAPIEVSIVEKMQHGHRACYGWRHLMFSMKALSPKWFNNWRSHKEDVLDLIYHELGHDFCDNHLDTRFHNALTKAGARATLLALKDPDMFTNPLKGFKAPRSWGL